MPDPGNQKPIDWQTFKDLCEIKCTQEEIAYILRVDIETLRYKVKKHFNAEFTDVYDALSAYGTMSVRRKIWNKALEEGHWGALEKLADRYTDMAAPKEIAIDPELNKLIIDLSGSITREEIERKKNDQPNSGSDTRGETPPS